MWSVRLRSPAKSSVLRIDSASSLQAFREQALTALGLAVSDGYTFKGGFPPKELHVEGDAPMTNVVQNNDTVLIEPALAAARPGPATRSMTPKMAPKTAPKAPPAPPRRTTTIAAKKAKRVPKPKFTGHGHVLGSTVQDDDAESDAPIEPSPLPKRRKMIQLGSKEDVGEKLVHAVSSHRGASTTDKFLRSATKSAVNHQYEMTLANARLHAALAGAYSMQTLTPNALGVAQMRVRFLERARTWRDEQLDLLQPTELTSILKYVLLSGGETGREMLKPFNMAQCSPRVFWSLARLSDGDVAAALEKLLPNEDWSFLGTRTRTLSAKALEAQTHSQHYRTEVRDEEPPLPTADSDVPVVSEMETPRVDRASMRSVAAKAALARLRAAEPVAPMRAPEISDGAAEDVGDDDVSTVVCDACQKARIVPADKSQIVGLDECGDWTCARLAAIGRGDGCAMVDDEVLSIVTDATIGACLIQIGVRTRAELASAAAETLFSSWRTACRGHLMDLDRLECFIEQARDEELDAMVQNIVGDSDVYDALVARKLATPHDVMLTPADVILRDVRSALQAAAVSLDTIQQWKLACASAVEQHPWLDDWRSI
ncbi:hypothetical protein SPRG_08562 [Saprolegnia parasitica CBS 223.65]|uniref:ubiquitinyl hydrolase 1 n=1 Tax=Saprolegnia parasitica (strain CBS 223.65) TaxID=695850 RepID=A0A067CAN2_SAPPC|nr:hypothetical protein SPRG_08562 [Saprolegnia parasitica CBS 223.65]KDO26200.1 hypothetical protein SPRG_08562 [Saprolegnia parasitica CBS 223.65]|eukprot:XP_012203193.1 hypothetical protein SPRG_08562 [Saprolegnia parasitica CBS 223.65]